MESAPPTQSTDRICVTAPSCNSLPRSGRAQVSGILSVEGIKSQLFQDKEFSDKRWIAIVTEALSMVLKAPGSSLGTPGTIEFITISNVSGRTQSLPLESAVTTRYCINVQESVTSEAVNRLSASSILINYIERAADLEGGFELHQEYASVSLKTHSIAVSDSQGNDPQAAQSSSGDGDSVGTGAIIGIVIIIMVIIVAAVILVVLFRRRDSSQISPDR
jgi:hypothetical protein